MLTVICTVNCKLLLSLGLLCCLVQVEIGVSCHPLEYLLVGEGVVVWLVLAGGHTTSSYTGS